MESENEKLYKEYEEYAKANGFQLNPNRAVVDNLINSLLKREKESGERYCPCRRITEDKEENKRIVCPCAYHKKEIEEDGHCLCFLFVK
jgi:ferredoxin-thioredoxin reductase catalytic subunit